MTEQLTFDHDGNVLEMFDALVKESELYEQPSSVDPNAPDTIRNAWRKAKQDRIKEFKKKQALPYDEKLERQREHCFSIGVICRNSAMARSMTRMAWQSGEPVTWF